MHRLFIFRRETLKSCGCYSIENHGEELFRPLELLTNVDEKIIVNGSSKEKLYRCKVNGLKSTLFAADFLSLTSVIINFLLLR